MAGDAKDEPVPAMGAGAVRGSTALVGVVPKTYACPRVPVGDAVSGVAVGDWVAAAVVDMTITERADNNTTPATRARCFVALESCLPTQSRWTFRISAVSFALLKLGC
jgi:hypothetical protein